VEIATLCSEIEAKKQEMDDAEREYREKCTALRSVIDPWRIAEAQNGNHQNSVDVLADNTVQIQYKNQYSPFAESSEEALLQIVGDQGKYDRLFGKENTLSVKKTVANDQKKLEVLMEKLLKVMSPEEFATYFELDTKIKCKPDFDSQRYTSLTEDQNKAMEANGLKQTVVVMCR